MFSMVQFSKILLIYFRNAQRQDFFGMMTTVQHFTDALIFTTQADSQNLILYVQKDQFLTKHLGNFFLNIYCLYIQPLYNIRTNNILLKHCCQIYYSVCNWPWSSAPCENEEEETSGGEEAVPEEVVPEEVVPEEVVPEEVVQEEVVPEEEETTSSGEEVTTVGEVIDESEYEEETEEEASGEEDEDVSNVIIIPSFDYQCTDEGLFPHDSNCAKFWLCKGIEPNLFCPTYSERNIIVNITLIKVQII